MLCQELLDWTEGLHDDIIIAPPLPCHRLSTFGRPPSAPPLPPSWWRNMSTFPLSWWFVRFFFIIIIIIIILSMQDMWRSCPSPTQLCGPQITCPEGPITHMCSTLDIWSLKERKVAHRPFPKYSRVESALKDLVSLRYGPGSCAGAAVAHAPGAFLRTLSSTSHIESTITVD